MFLNELSQLSELPYKEIISNFKIEYIGEKIITVTNYLKIITFHTNQIVLKVKNNALNIEGVGFSLKSLSKKELTIVGKINKIYLSREHVDETK